MISGIVIMGYKKTCKTKQLYRRMVSRIWLNCVSGNCPFGTLISDNWPRSVKTSYWVALDRIFRIFHYYLYIFFCIISFLNKVSFRKNVSIQRSNTRCSVSAVWHLTKALLGNSAKSNWLKKRLYILANFLISSL